MASLCQDLIYFLTVFAELNHLILFSVHLKGVEFFRLGHTFAILPPTALGHTFIYAFVAACQ